MQHRFLPLVAAVATTAFALTASAQVTLDLGTFVVDSDATTGDISLVVPAGVYTSYSFTTDWSAIAGDPWSVEAIWAITDGPVSDPGTTFYEDPGSSPDAQTSGDPVTLTWDGFLDVPLTSTGTPGEFFLLTLQTFGGSSAQWANTQLTLGFDVVSPPAATQAFLDQPAETAFTLDAGEVEWFEFDYNGTDDFVLHTGGTDLEPSNDTELGLYDSAGNLVAVNDDAGTLLSALVINGGDIAAGTYYLAVGAFDTVFGATEFNVSSSSSNSGTVNLHGLSVVPEPASISLLAAGGLLLVRRRRA